MSKMKEKKQKNEKNKLIGTKKMSVIKIVLILLIIAVVLIIAILAWFTFNLDSRADGMDASAVNLPFEIVTEGEEGKFAGQYRSIDENGRLWLVDESNDFADYADDAEQRGIEPGSKGKLKFLIRSLKGEDIALDIEMLLKGVIEGESGKLSELAPDESTEALRKKINAHIMLFENYNQVSGKYSGLIECESDLRRYLKNQVYSEDNSEYTYLYWVWPKYLSDITDTDPIYESSEREHVIDYIAGNREGFFSNLSPALTSKIKENLMSKTSYASYSESFDKVDLQIGNNIDYVILALNAYETQ